MSDHPSDLIAGGGLLSWRPRMTFRTRLTLTFSALIAGAGILVIGAANVVMRVFPVLLIGENLRRELHAGPAPDAKSAIVTRSTNFLDTNLLVSVIVLLVVVIAGTWFAWVLAGRILHPLKSINRAAQVAATGSFDHRVGLQGPRDEVRDLADTFDHMLDRLGRSFHAHRRFSANASHELQTPLATTQTMLEVALHNAGLTYEELRAVAEQALETNRRSIDIVTALLDLADAESGQMKPSTVDIARLTGFAIDEVAAEAEARRIRMATQIETGSITIGDEVLLSQALSNVLRNAVRHNIDGGSVEVVVTANEDRVRVQVANTGPVLTSAQVEEYAEPFARGDGRTASVNGLLRGHGLGIPIVNSVIDAHDGTSRLTAIPSGGMLVELTFPKPKS